MIYASFLSMESVFLYYVYKHTTLLTDLGVFVLFLFSHSFRSCQQMEMLLITRKKCGSVTLL